jgi:hypothetical protein
MFPFLCIPSASLNADPDRTFHFNADPDPAPHQRDVNLRPLVYRSRAHGAATPPFRASEALHGSILSLKDPEI